MNTGITAINEEVQRASAFVRPLFSEIGKVVVGQTYLVERLVIGLLANGHVLSEACPAWPKRLSVKTLAAMSQCEISRLQFTPDMLPADVIGTQIYNPQSGGFHDQTRPIFANLVLADEINRAPAKVQSALLEAMQEKQVTIGDTDVQAGRAVPRSRDAESDRAGRHLSAARSAGRSLHAEAEDRLSDRDEERQILDLMARTSNLPHRQRRRRRASEILDARQVINDIYIDDKVKDYIVDLVCATREPDTYKIQGARTSSNSAPRRARRSR